MIRYKVKLNYKDCDFPPYELNCRHIVFNGVNVTLFTDDFISDRCFNLTILDSIEIEPYFYFIAGGEKNDNK